MLVMWGVWWVSWRWFARLSDSYFMVQRAGDQWMVEESFGLWHRSMDGFRPGADESVAMKSSHRGVDRLPNQRHDALLEAINPGERIVLFEVGSPWPALTGYRVFGSNPPNVRVNEQLEEGLPLLPAVVPTRIHWAGFLAWLAVFGVIGSAMWEAPKLAWRAMVRRRRARLGLCRQCGYSLEGIDGVCPECGRARDRDENSA